MNRTSQPFFNGAHSGVLPSYEMLKEEQEVAVLGAPQSQAPVTTTVINIRSETSVPDHIVWSLFNTIFMNWCCLGFVAFAYSVKEVLLPSLVREATSFTLRIQTSSLVQKRKRTVAVHHEELTNKDLMELEA
eukprot:bmy_04967T0